MELARALTRQRRSDLKREALLAAYMQEWHMTEEERCVVAAACGSVIPSHLALPLPSSPVLAVACARRGP
jgi:hypothetical protein